MKRFVRHILMGLLRSRKSIVSVTAFLSVLQRRHIRIGLLELLLLEGLSVRLEFVYELYEAEDNGSYG
jgi:hypothetical protein